MRTNHPPQNDRSPARQRAGRRDEGWAPEYVGLPTASVSEPGRGACLVYLGEMLAYHERQLAELLSGEHRGSMALVDRHGHEVDILRERIAAEIAVQERQRQRGAHAQPAEPAHMPPSTTP